MTVVNAADMTPVATHYADALREARALLQPGPAECCICDGCRCEWAAALAVIEEALKPVGFISAAGGDWQKMNRRDPA